MSFHSSFVDRDEIRWLPVPVHSLGEIANVAAHRVASFEEGAGVVIAIGDDRAVREGLAPVGTGLIIAGVILIL